MSNGLLRSAPSSFGQTRHALGDALRVCRSAFAGVALLSCATNVLALTGSFFMLEVYDRVIPSHSVPTLVALSILAIALYLFQGCLEVIRSRLLVRIGIRVDEVLNKSVYRAIMSSAVQASTRSSLTPLRDLDQLRSFCSSLGPTALFDLPWVPFYLIICFMFHPVIGITALAGAIVLFVLTMVTEVITRAPNREALACGERRMVLAEAARRGAETIRALGMSTPVEAEWFAANETYMARQRRVSDVASGMSTLSRYFRMMLQSGMLALGAYLVIQQQATGGIMIASSILMSRALAPVELAISNWAGFVSARRSWSQLRDLLAATSPEGAKLALPAPKHSLSLDKVSGAAPGGDKLIVRDVTFELKVGEALGIIGSSGCGKSTLVRLLVGGWKPVGGKIRLDGATQDQWTGDALGAHLGYLPQEVDLMSGSIAKNIARFDSEATSEQIIAAAQAAGVHEMILGFNKGYEMEVGERGSRLSAGQKQRIALARALFRDPFLVVLDEPNSNLDSEGELALSRAILAVRMRGGIVVVVAHRPSALLNVSRVLLMKDGQVEMLGDRDAVISRFLRPAEPAGGHSQPVKQPLTATVGREARA